MGLPRPGELAHIGIPGLAPVIAMTLFLVGLGAAIFAYWYSQTRRTAIGKAVGVGVGILALGCLGLGTAVPLIIHATPTFKRPTTAARLQIVSPTPGEVLKGDPVSVPVTLQLDGGKVVSFSSLHLVPDEGHIHLYLDGSLVSMTGLESQISASPGQHLLRAEFVAVDHGPFQPRVTATVTFQVEP